MRTMVMCGSGSPCYYCCGDVSLSLFHAVMRRFRQWFLDSMSGVKKRLLRHSKPSNLTFIGEELERGEFYPKMVCQKCLLLRSFA